MITDEELIRLLELADPARVDDLAPVLDPAEYCDALLTSWTPVTLVDREPTPTPPTSGRRWPILIAAAAAVVVVAIAVVATRDDAATPADQPSPTVTVPLTTPPRALPNGRNVQLEPGTYYVDEVSGTPTPRISATIGAGWLGGGPEWSMLIGNTGSMAFDRPVAVFSDACHPSSGYHPGSVTTLDGLVAALTEQQGWADVTDPTDISIDGYAGKAFQRTVPTNMSDCDDPRVDGGRGRIDFPDDGVAGWADFRSWENPSEAGGGGSYYEPGGIETVWVVDLDGTVVVISTQLWWGPTAAAHPDFADAELDSIRIDPATSPRALVDPPGEQFEPGTYFIDEVDGTPTPRIFVTIGAGWRDISGDGTALALGGPDPIRGVEDADLGVLGFSRPPSAVFADACHWKDGYFPGSVTTVDGLADALTEQQGWAEVNRPSRITVDGHVGKRIRRIAPADVSECDTMPMDYSPRIRPDHVPPYEAFRSSERGGGHEPGEIEILWILDINGSVVVINTTQWVPTEAARAEFVTVLGSIHIDQPSPTVTVPPRAA